MIGSASGAGPPLQRGDVVAVRLPPGERWLGIIDSALGAEAALVPVDHRLPPAAVRALLGRARPTLLIDGDGWRRLPDGRPGDGAVALIVPTSGSSGRPRLVELSRTAVVAAVSASLEHLGAHPEDGWVSCLPLSHIGGLLVVLRGLLGGARVRFQGPEELAPPPGHRFVSVVPTQLVRALDGGLDLRGYRAMLVGGGGVEEAVHERALASGAPCVVTYGLTQSCGGVVYDGLPLPGVGVRISDAGEVELSGPTLLSGYREGGGPGLTADGWLGTGDAGRLDQSGRLLVRGRIDELIVTGGEKVWPGDVEAALRSHPGVADCAVFGRRDPVWGMRVVAAVVPRERGEAPSLAALRDHVGTVLGRHLAPRELVVVESLPRTPLGKLRRGALGRPAGPGIGRDRRTSRRDDPR